MNQQHKIAFNVCFFGDCRGNFEILGYYILIWNLNIQFKHLKLHLLESVTGLP